MPWVYSLPNFSPCSPSVTPLLAGTATLDRCCCLTTPAGWAACTTPPLIVPAVPAHSVANFLGMCFTRSVGVSGASARLFETRLIVGGGVDEEEEAIVLDGMMTSVRAARRLPIRFSSESLSRRICPINVTHARGMAMTELNSCTLFVPHDRYSDGSCRPVDCRRALFTFLFLQNTNNTPQTIKWPTTNSTLVLVLQWGSSNPHDDRPRKIHQREKSAREVYRFCFLDGTVM